MLRGRVANDIFVFTSELYAQVTAGAVVTPLGAVLIDTLPFPPESHRLARFLQQACPAGVRYVILTHYHADHVYGAYLFAEVEVVAHADYNRLVAKFGAPALRAAQAEEPELAEVNLRAPDITFEEGEITIQLGKKTLRLIHVPGHTQDSIMVYVESNRVLFASDTITPVPSIADGDTDVLKESLRKVAELPVENLVQGHGEVILRGEVSEVVQASLRYLDNIEAKVDETIKKKKERQSLHQVEIESCGLSRIPLNGLVQQIHLANLLTLYDRRMNQ